MKHDGKQVAWHKEIADSTLAITGFGVDSQGELLICDHRGQDEGGIYTLDPTPPVTTPSTFPRTLSETGLFTAVKGHQVQPGADSLFGEFAPLVRRRSQGTLDGLAGAGPEDRRHRARAAGIFPTEPCW